MGGKIVQSVAEAAERDGLDLAFYLSFAATPPILGAISMTTEIAMAPNGYADRSNLYGGWLKQLAAVNEANGGRVVIDEATYREHYVGTMPIGLQGYGLRYRDNRFVRDHWADIEDYKAYDFASFPRIAMVMPNDPMDGRHAVSDEGNWGMFIVNRIVHGDIGRSKVDLEALPGPQWTNLVDLARSAPDRLSRGITGNHFFFVGESGARAAARAVRQLDDEVQAFEAELTRSLTASK